MARRLGALELLSRFFLGATSSSADRIHLMDLISRTSTASVNRAVFFDPLPLPALVSITIGSGVLDMGVSGVLLVLDEVVAKSPTPSGVMGKFSCLGLFKIEGRGEFTVSLLGAVRIVDDLLALTSSAEDLQHQNPMFSRTKKFRMSGLRCNDHYLGDIPHCEFYAD